MAVPIYISHIWHPNSLHKYIATCAVGPGETVGDLILQIISYCMGFSHATRRVFGDFTVVTVITLFPLISNNYYTNYTFKECSAISGYNPLTSYGDAFKPRI